jgi:uncharacterized peroxidase-related enzyme
MSRLTLESESTSDPQVREVFAEIAERAGRVPAAYRAFALHPHILQANWNRTKNILGQGQLPPVTKEAIATRVCSVNGCRFCLRIHQANLEALGVSPAEAEAIAGGQAHEPRLAHVLGFVATATREPQLLGDGDFAQLRDDGYSDRDILEILTVMEMYTGYNKIIVALDLQPDD